MPKVAISITQDDVIMAKHVYEGLAISDRNFSHFVEAWTSQASGKPIYPQRKLRSLYNAARGKTIGIFSKFYEQGVYDPVGDVSTAEHWAKYVAVDSTAEVNVARQPPSPPDAPPPFYRSPSGVSCERMNKYGFYPIIVDEHDRAKVLHSCIEHAPPEIKQAFREDTRARRIAEEEKKQTEHDKKTRLAAAIAAVDKEDENEKAKEIK
jgi:hypothetical protein